MQSKAATVAAYLASVPVERRAELSAVRRVIKRSLPKGYAETMQYGMISYVVPLKRYPAGYLGKKGVGLPYVCLAAQKNYLALYLLNLYSDPKTVRWFKSEWAKSKKKLDMGKSCLRFRTADELALDVIAETIAKTPVKAFIERYERVRGRGA
jgi:hypothetical protein